MPFHASAIANHFIDLAASRGPSLTPMKLQKLVYFAHGWYLAVKGGEPLIDEQVEAWAYGPVIPSLYRALRQFGDQPVPEPIDDPGWIEQDDGRWGYHAPSLSDVPEKEAFARSLLDRVWEIYGPYTAIQLSNMTHEPGTPWAQVRELYATDGHIPKGTDIPRDSIRDYFRSRLRSQAAKA